MVIKPSGLQLWHKAKASSISSPFPLLALIHTSLKRERERGRAASALNTHRQASLMVSRYTTPATEVVHSASPRGRLQHWYVKKERDVATKTSEIAVFTDHSHLSSLGLMLWKQPMKFEIRYQTRSSAVAERPRALRVIEYFAKSLKITQGHSK